MYDLPLRFDYNGEHYRGCFMRVSGAASERTWNLILNSRYRGCLILKADGEWVFHSQDGEFEDMTDWFGDFITACYQ